MSTNNVEQSTGSAINPAENLSGWLDEKLKRDAEPEAETGQSTEPASPAEPNLSQPDQPDPEDYAEPWWEQGLADAKHGFLKGRKGPEVEKAFRHVETAKQRAEREAAELRQQLEQMRIERAAEEAVQRRVGTQAQPEQPADPYAELESLIFENPREYTRRLHEIAVQEAEQRALQRWQEAQEIQETQYRQEVSVSAGQTAVREVAHYYGVDEGQAARMVMSAFTHMAANDDTNIWTDPRNYVAYVGELYGYPQPRQVTPPPVAPVSEVPDPPGSKRPAPARRGASEPSPLKAEAEETRRSLASALGLDPDFVTERARARGGRRVN